MKTKIVRSSNHELNLASLVLFPLLIVVTAPAKAQSLSAADSNLTIPIRLNLATAQAQVNAAVPSELARIDQKNAICVEAQWLETKGIPKCKMEGIKIYCEDNWIKTKITPEVKCDISGWIRRSGPIALDGSGQKLRVSIPIKASISAKAIAQETADAEAVIFADVIPSIDSSWNPTIRVEPNFTWTQRPTIKLFNAVKVTIGSEVEPKLREELQKMAREAPELLEKLELRQKVEAAWRGIQKPQPLLRDPESFIQFSPNSAQFSGIHIENGILYATVGISGKTTVTLGKPKVEGTMVALPSLQAADRTGGSFSLMIPVVMPHAKISKYMNEKFPKGYEIALQRGEMPARVVLDRLRVSSTQGGDLLISVRVDFDTRSKFWKTIDVFDWLTFSGDLTFTGRPVLKAATRELAVKNLTYTASTSSRLTDSLISLAGIEPIRNFLQDQIMFPFGPHVDKARGQANLALANIKIGNAKLTASLDMISLDSVENTNSGIMVNTRMSGTAGLDVGL
ncbi:hypothetical protein HDC36_001780 [Xanthomonas sp. JAI131]|uniref:DUF4403 family protein n=1 Tax=Xanthomonas sp. JAI131 TaxID=2723067 RepID=UPI0015CB1797|nr:DUF4403 family protein [Xanthomonas sp. JAI131]NYF20319.1 hypothetical protein [Xanthomonas sp. JAI131]